MIRLTNSVGINEDLPTAFHQITGFTDAVVEVKYDVGYGAASASNAITKVRLSHFVSHSRAISLCSCDNCWPQYLGSIRYAKK